MKVIKRFFFKLAERYKIPPKIPKTGRNLIHKQGLIMSLLRNFAANIEKFKQNEQYDYHGYQNEIY